MYDFELRPKHFLPSTNELKRSTHLSWVMLVLKENVGFNLAHVSLLGANDGMFYTQLSFT